MVGYGGVCFACLEYGVVSDPMAHGLERLPGSTETWLWQTWDRVATGQHDVPPPVLWHSVFTSVQNPLGSPIPK